MRQAANHDATGASARAARLAGQDAEAPANASRTTARLVPFAFSALADKISRGPLAVARQFLYEPRRDTSPQREAPI